MAFGPALVGAIAAGIGDAPAVAPQYGIAAIANAGLNVGASLAPRSTVGNLAALLAIAAATLVVVATTRGRLGYPANG